MTFPSKILRAVLPYRFLASARMVQIYLTGSHDFYERHERRTFFRRAFWLLNKNKITGDYAEFGCHGGMTFVLAYHHSRRFDRGTGRRKLWAFDSFQGLPAPTSEKDSHPSWRRGALETSRDEFLRICKGSEVPASAFQIVEGFYEETIGANSRQKKPQALPGDIALAYIDCDLYSSTKTVLEFLSSRLKHGMILAFDDYYLYSAQAAAGERVAFLEFSRAQPDYLIVPYVQFGASGMSFIVEHRDYTIGAENRLTPQPW